MKFAVSMLLASAAFTAHAQDLVYGFEVGKPLGLAECARLKMPAMKNYTPPYAPVSAPCLKPSSASMGQIAFPISSPAKHAAGGDLGYGLAADGALEVIVVPTAGAPAQEAVYQDLVAKYGSPTTSSTTEVVSGSGARFDARRATWSTASLRIEFFGVDGRFDMGRVIIGTPTGVQARINLLNAALPSRPM